ncbi:MAG TPA: aminotransferase class V-fold PLP-dependent enzyme [Candidatus Sulfomarinibacteraceae bacterium]|nr:aminotransferase class V-fold PLP-dependent enzyme [Candidatus Sulfomarinibacteraceae bacterium]
MDDRDRAGLLREAAQRAIRYLESAELRSVAPSPEVVAALDGLDIPLPHQGASDGDVLRALDELGSPASMVTNGPRFFGFVTGGVLPAALAANWLAAAWDQNAMFHAAAPAVVMLERVALSWLLDLFDLPSDSAGAFVTGATMANFVALASARHAVLEEAGWDVEAHGLFGAPRITVVVSEEAHASIYKALGMLGLGRNRVLKLPVDGQGRIRTDDLPLLNGPAIVCAQAGNVNTGSFDPVGALAEWARQSGAWLHVDGAFGLWAAAAPTRAHLALGISEADSWATDAHKWLNVPYDSGLAFVRRPQALRAAMAVSADYLPEPGDHRDPSDYTPELSRRSRGVEVWAALRSLGREGVADLVERCCQHARRFAGGLQEAGHEILNDVVLNQVLVSFGDEATTRRVIAGIQEEGTSWCGGTVWQGRRAMRISVSGWETTEEDVERSLEAMLKVAARHT